MHPRPSSILRNVALLCFGLSAACPRNETPQDVTARDALTTDVDVVVATGDVARFDDTNCDCDATNDVGATATILDAPRLIAPLSTSSVSVPRPHLRWVLNGGDGARVDVCRD